ncbi:MAG: 1-deoxy-D-xylulose-5-phosphate synthase, partial [Clostridia bacterium]|nr:1-deoxy-D-xylulose-5-phosphate synthase [Clostridia bacterium]
VGHQSYVHKLLTGRRDEFDTLRKPGGLSGFTRRSESEHDAFGAGHSSTAISAAVGFAEGDRISGNDAFSVAVVGDGAFTGGMVHEALNNCRGDLKLIVILNENEMSISKNTGAFANHIAKIRSSPRYLNTKSRTGNFVSRIPLVGDAVYAAMRDTKKLVKNMIFSSNYFEEMGLFYLGPANGNDYFAVERLLRAAKEKGESVILHLKTVKGKGYAPAELNPSAYHGIPPAGTPSVRNFSAEMGACLVKAAKKDPRICAITASMGESTGLAPFGSAYPDRYFDVGIAEEHAATFAAGLAAEGKKPVFAVYSSFLQRSYDSLIHDIGLQGLGVVLCVDRAGLSAADGATHHGILDVSFLSQIKGMKIYAPTSFASLRRALALSLSDKGPCAVRYPNCGEITDGGWLPSEHPMISTDFEAGAELDAVIITYGKIVKEAQAAVKLLEEQGIRAGIILLEQIAPAADIAAASAALIPDSARCVLYLEEGVRAGGAGMLTLDAMSRFCADKSEGKALSLLAIEDCYVHSRKNETVYETAGISAKHAAEEIKRLLAR